MSIKSLIHFILKSPLKLIIKITKTTNELYRAGFVATAISQGIYKLLLTGPMTCKDIAKVIGIEDNYKEFEAWLDLGVSLGELKKNQQGYSIKGLLSREISKAQNDSWLAYFQSRVEIFYDYIIKTPSLLKQQRRINFSEAYGELFARSSRTIEPIMLNVVDNIIPKNGSKKVLEIGCGSGIYIKRACDINPELTVTGLELQTDVADYARKNMDNWNIADKVNIEAVDIRNYQTETKFDLVTLHNLIYYFPINQRVELLKLLSLFLKPKGQLIISSLCKGPNPATEIMNLWASMTEGCGSLPEPGQIFNQLQTAGFSHIISEKLITDFYLFKASL